MAQTEPLLIQTQDGRSLQFQVEIANSPHSRAQGLMYRKVLPEKQGMLFVFSQDEIRSFWMRNTYIPLDIIFIHSSGSIVSIGEGVPLSEASVVSVSPAQAVLELEQGTAKEMGIQAGDKVFHPLISPK